MKTTTFDYSGFYTIILTKQIGDPYQVVRKIFEDCWTLYIANANLLVQADDLETILLYTFFPFKPKKCEDIEPVIHDYFVNNAFAHNAEIFPNKFHNFYKCPLKISLFEIQPYMILKQQPDGSYETEGLEGTMLRFISEKLNFRRDIILSSYNYRRIQAREVGELRMSLEMVTRSIRFFFLSK